MKYHDQPLQYINRYYFHTKTGSDDQYVIILTIICLIGFVPFALWFAVSMLSVVYIYPKVTTLLIKFCLAQLKEVEVLMKKLNKAEDKDIQIEKISVDENGKRGVYLVELKSDVYEREVAEMAKSNRRYVRKVKNEDNKYMIDLSANKKWKVYDKTLLILSSFLNLALLIFHIFSVNETTKYDDNVFQSQLINYTVVPSSAVVIIGTYLLAIILPCFLVCKFCKAGFDTKFVKENACLLLTAILITVNIIHLVCYFMPYMLLAFVYNPIQTVVVYLLIGITIFGVYLLLYILNRCLAMCTRPSDSHPVDFCFSFYKRRLDLHTSNHDFITFYTRMLYYRHATKPKEDKCKAIFYVIYFYLLIGTLAIIVYYVFVINFALTWGSIDDLVKENLVPPLLIGFLTYFVLKPSYKQAKQKIKPEDESHIPKMLESCEGNIQCEVKDNNNDIYPHTTTV